ncbi:pisatin demethylase [Cercophora newfieldiana]|uniref:Pisatin demethylase n=1 Tax=Cercophora newfieldiana TaxID=92897 RepID=A0AA39Y550_9PEZI|nr:pisatin demethylase [Cercophora newfieldiana]
MRGRCSSCSYRRGLPSSTLRHYFRLRHIPGPPLVGFSKWWLASSARRGRMHLDLYEAIEKYGPDLPFTRVGPQDIITGDPVFLRQIVNTHSLYQRSDWYTAMRFDPTRDNILSLRDDEMHTKHRAKLAPGYSGRDVGHLEPRVDRNILELINLLDRDYVSKGRVFDFGRKAQYFTMDVIADVAFGQAFGFVASDSDMYDYIGLLEKLMPTLIMNQVFPWVVDVMADAESEILVQVLAGSDTTATATAIRATTLHVITSPRVETRLRAEIAAAGVASRPWNTVISDAEARRLPYLQAVVKEGLRIFPPAVGLGSKSVPPAGDTYRGDAEEFRPERWLQAEGGKLREMEATLDLVFGTGRWQCLGRNVALMELNKIFVELLRRFELVVMKPGEPWHSRSAGLFTQNEFWLKGYRRG